MKRVTLTYALAFWCVIATYAQTTDTYYTSTKKAYSLYEKGEFKESAQAYQQAFAANGGKATLEDRYNAACSYALSEQVDSAFYHLFYLAENPKIAYHNLDHISTDSDLDILHKLKRWDELLAIVSANKKEYEKDFDHELVAMLDSVYATDQLHRREIMTAAEEKGNDSKEVRALWKIQSRYDSLNTVAVTKILDERGWLGADVIGGKGNLTLFLVIQHADTEVQEKYLPMMRQAVKDGKAEGSSLAMLEDRVALAQGRKQLYGSQIHTDMETNQYYVAPLEDPDNVDARRAEVGLPPLASYTEYFGFKWNLEEFKKEQAAREAKEKAAGTPKGK
jgi:hypothetical protein